MSQDLVSLVFADEELAALDAAIATVERFSQSFVSLTAEQVRSLSKMGDRSEPFCRIAPIVFRQYPNALPPCFDLAEMERDISTFDALRPPALRLQQVWRSSTTPCWRSAATSTMRPATVTST